MEQSRKKFLILTSGDANVLWRAPYLPAKARADIIGFMKKVALLLQTLIIPTYGAFRRWQAGL